MASSIFREKGDKMCVHHPKEECSFMCEDCDTPICENCISTLHHGHRIKSLRIVAQDKFNFIQDFDDRINSETIPKINDGVQTADDVVQELKKLIDQGKQHFTVTGFDVIYNEHNSKYEALNSVSPQWQCFSRGTYMYAIFIITLQIT